MTDSLISIIMPVYNCSKFLEESITSILNQTYSNFEFIIIDGASTDGTPEIVRSFSDNRIIFLEYNFPHLAKQLNYGLKHAKGKYIARMDGDDISFSDRFEKQINFLQTNKNIHIVGSNYIRIDENGRYLFKKIYPEYHEEIEYMMTVMPGIMHPTIVTYKSILDDLGGYPDEQDSIIEDVDLYFLLLERNYIFYNIQEYLLKYRLRKDSVGGLYGKKQAEQIYAKSKIYLFRKYQDKNDKDMLYFRLALLEYYLGTIKKSRYYFLQSFLIDKKKLKKILRYMPLLFLPSSFVKYLRNKGILYSISIKLNKYLNLDLFQFKK